MGRPKERSYFVGIVIVILVLIGIVGLNAIAWTSKSENHKKSQLQASGCAFRITEEDAPLPVTEGDAVQLDTCFKLERVTNDSRLRLGLANRNSIPWDQGMLFDFGQPSQYCMWMKGMRFGLDIIWIDAQREIVDLRENISPDTFPQSFCGSPNASYVIEANDGVIRAGDLHVGQHLNL
jgi:uncharacterized membrane protein (UPF0127 family)